MAAGFDAGDQAAVPSSGNDKHGAEPDLNGS
jgi:hypothetical protein